jgi:hypothetical protein
MLPTFSRHLAAQQAPLKERTMSRHQLDWVHSKRVGS